MRVALGVGGGIAAYKAAELARALGERGCTVEVIMTDAAREFIQPLTFASLTGRKVITGLWAQQDGSGEGILSSAVEHIRVAQDNELLVIAPATANLIASFAHGQATDFLTTLYLAFTGTVVIAPAMNTNMWQHPATVENVRILRERGHVFVDPADGLLACGVIGPGRLAEPEIIADQVIGAGRPAQPNRDLEGETILITAGPTQEPLDPVRFISNRSSGKMGYAIAAAAAARGAKVVLISGPVAIPAPDGVEIVHVETAKQMRAAVLENLDSATIIIKAAAVADYHLVEIPKQKMKKTATRLSLDLEPTPDILAEVGQKKGDRLLIGFAAETQNLIEEARRKLKTKNCDMVVGNIVSRDDIGFGTDDNEVVLVLRTGESVPVARASKRSIADSIFDQALRLRLALHHQATP
ncbi:MAG TPA: bifunctional phosphopantothenoylcysteine decarboxylase/phosphopantothenate--cysteine ligase CoaBC [Bryobacteraceae bacterium]|nr:bifunctional phosphopantothenoylcysteine decarboxylase/phosphopantothenate--cysteine ligase CoaBC [Bryobacteraceae bacterium]